MKNKGFQKIGDWHLNENGRLDIEYCSSISNDSGIIAILVNNKPTLFSSTSHYGPRIRDFKHSLNGHTQSARIHAEIVNALGANETVSLWVKDSTSPTTDRNALLRTYNPKWNLQKHN
jgi:hypothetical protein